ncbi:MAG: aminoglycoside phosphotransferase [Acidimicrobiaceae bacterium]|nr:aminoglycoside phosphotransferase [Acidimicrobiaceae bacterium]
MTVASNPVELAPLAFSYLERQVWYQTAIESAPPGPLELISIDVLRSARPGLARLLLGRGEHRFQLLVGWRTPAEVAGVLRGRESALLGPWADDEGSVLAYDAIADDELDIELLAHVTGGSERASRVRRVSTLVSHASLVFDERLFMKCYRLLEHGARPEVEVVLRLDAVGFNALLAPVAHWREDGYDLALVREFLPSALEGRLLALTSLRDLLAHASEGDERSGEGPGHEGDGPGVDDPDAECASAGGDLASEMRRLGGTTARLHLALAAAFGDRPAGPSTFADAEAAVTAGSGEAMGQLASRLAAINAPAAGRTIRLHGDYHLRRVMRSETGWLVAGFSDDPLYAVARADGSLPGRRGSPLEDLADMCFAIRRVAGEALAQRPESEADTAGRLAAAWERRNQAAFLEGYVTTDGVRRLLPRDPAMTELILSGFELAREQRYEATSADA